MLNWIEHRVEVDTYLEKYQFNIFKNIEEKEERKNSKERF